MLISPFTKYFSTLGAFQKNIIENMSMESSGIIKKFATIWALVSISVPKIFGGFNGLEELNTKYNREQYYK